nr:immunoglobulin light chain junction region [Macaca mulatta]
WQQESNWRTF